MDDAHEVIDHARLEERKSRSAMRKTKRRQRAVDRPIDDLATHPTETVTPKVLAACPRVDCDVRTLLRMVEAGALVGYKVGREWRITVESARAAFHVQQPQAAS